MDENKIHHIISTGLVHNRYYKVYVTQVNKNGIESPRSDPALIRVGDVYAPPQPVLSIDTSEFSNGCYSVGFGITVMVKWTSSECDDLANYIGYAWHKRPEWFNGDGVYSADYGVSADNQYILTNTITSATLDNQPNGEYVYIGIQAVDISNNYTGIYVIRILAEDLGVLLKPTNPIYVEPHGIWSLRVYTECPKLSNIQTVVFYRDGWKQMTPVLFHKGLIAEIIDTLDVLDGLTHFYTYQYVTYDGRKSPMSDPSASVTAKPIDTTYIDKIALEELKKAWQADNIESIAELKRVALEQAQTIKELSTQLEQITTDYNEMYNNFTLAANEIKLLSAKVKDDEESMSAMQTSIEQNATAITLRATKTDIDNATGQLKSSMVSMIDQQADRIDTVVASTSGYSSQMTQLENMIQTKVSKGDLKSEIDLAVQDGISVAYIKADRIVLDGQMLLQGNARINGKLYSSDIALIDSQTNKVVWGAGTGTLNPTVTDLSWPDPWYCCSAKSTSWRRATGSEFYFTPRPPVNFTGTTYVTCTLTITVGLNYTSGDWHDDSWKFQRGSLHVGLNASTDGIYSPTGNKPEVHISGDGWTRESRTLDGRWCEALEYKEITLTYKGTMRIGEQMQFQVWFRNDEVKHAADSLFMAAATAHIEAI